MILRDHRLDWSNTEELLLRLFAANHKVKVAEKRVRQQPLRLSNRIIDSMDYQSWLSQVRDALAKSRPELSLTQLDSDVMYQAFANGVSPQTFASNPIILSGKRVPADSHADVPAPALNPPTVGAFKAGAGRPDVLTQYVSPEHARVIMGVFLVLIIILYFFLRAESYDSSDSKVAPINSSSDISNNSSANSRPSPNPVSDKDKYETARSAYSSWQGDHDTFAQYKAVLENIPDDSSITKQAHALLGRWKRREQRHEQQMERDALKQQKEEMKYFTGDGDVKVAVGAVELHSATEQHEAGRGSKFIYLHVEVLNAGSETIHANPDDFTLADSKGNTAAPDVDTYGLDGYFDAVDLRPNQRTGGWLIFYLHNDKRYKLTRAGGLEGQDITKTIIP